MAKQTRTLILEAFITLAKRYPQRSSFTMIELAAEAGVSRQAIYQKHFKNYEDILNYIHNEIEHQFSTVFDEYSSKSNQDPITFFAENVIPMIYEKRDVLSTLYTTQVDPGWKEFLIKTYSKWVLENVHFNQKYHFSDDDFAQIITTMAISFIEVWIRKENPTPPEKFKKTFLMLAQTSLYDYIAS